MQDCGPYGVQSSFNLFFIVCFFDILCMLECCICRCWNSCTNSQCYGTLTIKAFETSESNLPNAWKQRTVCSVPLKKLLMAKKTWQRGCCFLYWAIHSLFRSKLFTCFTCIRSSLHDGNCSWSSRHKLSGLQRYGSHRNCSVSGFPTSNPLPS